MSQCLCGVDHQRHTEIAAHLGELGQRLGHAAMAGERGEVDKRGRIVGHLPRGVVDGEPAEVIGGQHADLESVGGHDGEIGAVLAGRAREGVVAWPAAEQDVECVVGAGGEHDAGAAQASQCRDSCTTRVEHRRSRVGGDVPADLRFMPGVPGRRVDDREALP